MGRWLTKEERWGARKRIRQLKDRDGLTLTAIAKRMNMNYLRVLRLYYSREK